MVQVSERAVESQAVKVRRENIEACMKCPICNKLLKEATTISLCLHTFCRKCILEKLSDEEVDCCPVCGIDLGCVPVDKLRPDHALQDIREKIFPSKKRKINTLPETTNLPSPVVKRKERSLSSLGVTTPSVSLHTEKTTKPYQRRGSGSRGNTFALEELNKKKQNSILHIATNQSYQRQESSSSPEEQVSLKELNPIQNKENGVEVNDLWNPLHCLVEAANITKSTSKLDPPSLVGATKIARQHVVALPRPNMPLEPKHRLKFLETSLGMVSSKEGVKFQDNGSSSAAPVPVKRKGRPSLKKAASLENSSISAQRILDASRGNYNRHNIPIWFSLVACEDRNGEASLPQISSGYLRIKDRNVTVSVIQKYVMQKLHLKDESEVEIHCRGHPVLPTLQLHQLVDLWFHTADTRRVTATLGTTAKDFVMVLSYCRKPSTTIE